MGKRDELCITISPEEDDSKEIARQLDRTLAGDEVESVSVEYDDTYSIGRESVPDWDFYSSDCGFEDLHFEHENGNVYAYGVSWNSMEVEIWWEAVLSLGLGDGLAIVAYTQEALYGGYGYFYEWSDDGNKYVLTDSIEEPDGGYDTAVREYFQEEHGLFARTYSRMMLDPHSDES